MAIIEVRNLSKTFESFKPREGVWGGVKDLVHREKFPVTAVESISFSMEEGELVGYIGPNGAGKSTSIKMLTGILKPTAGEMSVMGMHPYEDRRKYTQKIGVVFGQRTQLWWDIAVIESFRLLGDIYRVSRGEFEERLEMLSEVLGLDEFLSVPVRKLSLGQRMRSDIAASLLHNPQVLFLDEPTIGLDAVAKDSIRSFLRKINKELKTTIILTTHDLNEIEELCDRIVVLDHGKVIFDGALSSIKGLPGLEREVVVDFSGEAPESAMGEVFQGLSSLKRESERRLRFSFDPSEMPTADVLKELFGRFEVSDISLSEPSIDEIIMKIYRDGAPAN